MFSIVQKLRKLFGRGRQPDPGSDVGSCVIGDTRFSREYVQALLDAVERAVDPPGHNKVVGSGVTFRPAGVDDIREIDHLLAELARDGRSEFARLLAADRDRHNPDSEKPNA